MRLGTSATKPVSILCQLQTALRQKGMMNTFSATCVCCQAVNKRRRVAFKTIQMKLSRVKRLLWWCLGCLSHGGLMGTFITLGCGKVRCGSFVLFASCPGSLTGVDVVWWSITAVRGTKSKCKNKISDRWWWRSGRHSQEHPRRNGKAHNLNPTRKETVGSPQIVDILYLSSWSWKENLSSLSNPFGALHTCVQKPSPCWK